jgi:hypothetical protein
MMLYCSILASAFVAVVSSLEVVLDDAGQHISPGASWTKAQGKCAQAGHLNGFHHNNGVHDRHLEFFAMWNFSVPKDGCYWVEEFHPDTSLCDFSLASQVPIVIHFCKGLHTAGYIDQSKRAGQWNRLTRLPFYVNRPAAIQIGYPNTDFDGVWAADAFRLVWDAADCHDDRVEADEAVAPADEAKAIEKITKEEEEENTLTLLQALVDDADGKTLGSTLEPISQCLATAARTFRHDALQKDQLAQVNFHFDPPRDGCYLIEESHPQLASCKASPDTKVHVNYCKGLEAVGNVDQTANAGQWTFLGAFPFYAGHPGNVTLSNKGTEPGTLALFDQVRFTWSGKSCRRAEAHPWQVKIRMTVDFKHVASRSSEFGSALIAKLAELAKVPEKSLRLTGLRSGSIIAELLVLPSVVDEPLAPGLDSLQIIESLRIAVGMNNADLCALTGAPLEGCTVEFTVLGVATPSVWPVPKRRPHQQNSEEEDERTPDQNVTIIIFLSTFCFLKLALIGAYLGNKSRKKQQEAHASANDADKNAESQVTASMEEGKALEEKNTHLDALGLPIGNTNEKAPVEEENDNASTLAPSSDKQSEPSVQGDAETASQASLVILKALSGGDI